MGTWHADGLEESAYHALGTVENADKALAEAWKVIHDPTHSCARLLPLVGQVDPRAGWPIGQVWAVALFLDALHRGDVLMRQLYVGESPGSDRSRDENAAALARLPEPWSAEVDLTQYGADQDGWLDWSAPRAFLRAESKDEPHGAWCALPEDSVPLEIGYTQPSKTWVHLQQWQGVARWPYGEKSVTVLAMPNAKPEQVWPIPEGRTAGEYLLDLHNDGVRLMEP